MDADMHKTYTFDYDRYNKKTASNAELFSKALADIKEAIKQDPHRENVGSHTLTLVRIYDIVEEAEKNLDLA
tara:strand:+ start:1116 stop:1331 length:216 start_codon:yes stop_codon:yes gene_type:complete